MAMQFKKAERKQSRLKLALSGPAGSGKSYGALLIAAGMGGKVAVIDTEHGSASLYSDVADYDVLELSPPYSPERFIEAIHTAEQAGYDTIIIDSITHEWDGAGGCLELNEKIAVAKFKGNTWSAWSETTPRHRKFVDAILQSKCHIIATMRSKTDTVQEGGKVKKIGMKDVQRDGTDYEFTVVLNISHDGHYATAGKDRTGLFMNRDPQPISRETGKVLLHWLNSGAVVVQDPTPVIVPAKSEFADATDHRCHDDCRTRLSLATNMAELKSAFEFVHSNRQHLTLADYGTLVTRKDEMKADIAAQGT